MTYFSHCGAARNSAQLTRRCRRGACCRCFRKTKTELQFANRRLHERSKALCFSLENSSKLYCILSCAQVVFTGFLTVARSYSTVQCLLDGLTAISKSTEKNCDQSVATCENIYCSASLTPLCFLNRIISVKSVITHRF